MLIVQNRIHVKPEFEERFAQRAREGDREAVPGRLFVARLKADDPGVYINLSIWDSREAFEAWRKSEAFRRAHSGGPPEGATIGQPQLTIAEVLQSEGSLSPISTFRA